MHFANGALIAPFFILCGLSAQAAPKHPKSTLPAETSPPATQLENYQDLISKAQNLTLQQDRLQTSQVLTRGLQRETKGSVAYRELTRALDELTAVFYTARAQGLFASADALTATKPREALDLLQEALKVEERHPTILKEMAREHLRLDECDKAETPTKQAEEIDPYSPEIKLLLLQILACQKNFEALDLKLAAHDADLDAVEKSTKGLQAQMLVRAARLAIKSKEDPEATREAKKARAFLQAWKTQDATNPETFRWDWELSKALGAPDRVSAGQYVQLCENLTPRKRKSFSLDVELCKGKDEADAFLKTPVKDEGLEKTIKEKTIKPEATLPRAVPAGS